MRCGWSSAGSKRTVQLLYTTPAPKEQVLTTVQQRERDKNDAQKRGGEQGTQNGGRQGAINREVARTENKCFGVLCVIKRLSTGHMLLG